ncbi:MAG: hypothetical protein GY801_07200 [bacterium]|nr:hypothetical protein [bacterium]
MLVFITSVKHPDYSYSYNKVWRLLNNTLYSICSQKDSHFRVIVVCNKQLPLFHHADMIQQFTRFIEVDFPCPGKEVRDNIKRLGNLTPPIGDPSWENKRYRPEWEATRTNVRTDKGSKLLIGILAAKEYNPQYIFLFDADDYVGNDIIDYVHAHPGENGWIMTKAYKMKGDYLQAVDNHNSICGTGNIYNYNVLLSDIPQTVSVRSSQNELFKEVNTEFLLMTLGRHVYSRTYYEKKKHPFKDYPYRSVIAFLGHGENDSDFCKGDSRQRPNRQWFKKLLFWKKLRRKRSQAKYFPITPKLKSYFNIWEEPETFS